jgi:hypothetical protein
MPWQLGDCLEPIILEVVALGEENSMKIENASLGDDLRAWMKSPAIGLPEYSADPVVQRRVGRMLSTLDRKFSPHPQRKLVVNSIQRRLSDKQ